LFQHATVDQFVASDVGINSRS